MKSSTESKTGMTPSPSGTSRTTTTTTTTTTTGKTDLDAFFQPNAITEGKVDWENMSRGAFSTVSKMKSAVEKMNSNNGSNNGSNNNNNNINNTQSNHHGGGRRPRSGHGTAVAGGGGGSLGTFLKRGTADDNDADAVPSDDRSRGAHSTMSHSVRRQRTQRPKRGTTTVTVIKNNASDHVSPFFQMPQDDRLPTKAERNLPTGNPKAQKKKSSSSLSLSSSSSFTSKPRSEKAQKNLELFMSRQRPIPKQDLEIRSAFTSVDRKRKNGRIVPATGAIPLPTNKEDLLQLLKAAAMAPPATTNTTTTAAAAVTTKKSPKPGGGGGNKSNEKGGLLEQQSTSLAPTPSRISRSAHSKTNVGRSPSPGIQPHSQSTKGEPARQIRRTISASLVTGSNGTKKPSKRTKSSQRSTKGTAATAATEGTVPQFSSLLPATTTHLDKPQPILGTLSGSSSSEMHHKETSILRSLSTTDIIGNIPSVDGTPKAVHEAQKSPTDNKNNENTTNQKITTRGLCKEVEGPRKKNTMTSDNNRKGGKPATTTTSKIMSARRLHHAPASSISQSPIAGRRQSLKMGLAGTASGEGQSRGTKTAVKRKKTKAAAATATPKKAASAIPTVPNMDHGASSSDMGDASKATATKRNRSVVRRTDGIAGGEARRSIRGRRTTAKTEFEDVFTFYQWSESRQAESKIMAERQILRDAIMDGGPLHRAFNRIA